jgi:hypothetical protein
MVGSSIVIYKNISSIIILENTSFKCIELYKF